MEKEIIEETQDSQTITDNNGAAGDKVAEQPEPKQSEEAPETADTDLPDAPELPQQQLEELKDKHLRLLAEFDNFKKRNARERLELISTAGQEVIVDLLPVLDDFDRAIKTSEKAIDAEVLKEGTKLIHEKLKGLLQQRGLKEMDSIGKPFDAEFHEAITEIPAADESQKGMVVDEIEKGYYLKGKIIRYAKVVVGK